jgi:hypothetical protein
VQDVKDMGDSLIVVEAGAAPPGWDDGGEVVVTQAPDEALPELVDRSVRELTSWGAPIGRAVLALNARADPEALVARSRLARATIRALARTGRGRLVIAARYEEGNPARFVAHGLAEILAWLARGTGVRVDVVMA